MNNAKTIRLKGYLTVEGQCEGEVISTTNSLSLWGGLDPLTGKIIDKFHPLNGKSVSGKIFVLPVGRGSSTGSGVLLEAILSNTAPKGIILREKDEIIVLGGIVANEVFYKEIPIVILNDKDFESAVHASYAKIDRNGYVTLTN